jgi:hypothetical protein
VYEPALHAVRKSGVLVVTRKSFGMKRPILPVVVPATSPAPR